MDRLAKFLALAGVVVAMLNATSASGQADSWRELSPGERYETLLKTYLEAAFGI